MSCINLRTLRSAASTVTLVFLTALAGCSDDQCWGNTEQIDEMVDRETVDELLDDLGEPELTEDMCESLCARIGEMNFDYDYVRAATNVEFGDSPCVMEEDSSSDAVSISCSVLGYKDC